MSKPSQRSPERKLQVVLSVLRGELSVAEAARRAGVAEQTVHNWKNAFLDAGRAGLAGPQRPRSSRRLGLATVNGVGRRGSRGLTSSARSPARSSSSGHNTANSCPPPTPND